MSLWEGSRVMVAVDDSPAALTAVEVAVGLAARTGAVLRFVHVIGDGELVGALAEAKAEARVTERRVRAGAALLHHVADLARVRGVVAESVQLEGEPARLVLAEARRWGADLLVIGRSDLRGAGRPYVGHAARHVLEFWDRPVLVVPQAGVTRPDRPFQGPRDAGMERSNPGR